MVGWLRLFFALHDQCAGIESTSFCFQTLVSKGYKRGQFEQKFLDTFKAKFENFSLEIYLDIKIFLGEEISSDVL